MTIDSSGSKVDTLHLRNRANVRSENSDEPKMSSMEQPRRNSGRTMGTTPDGTTFVVPETHDMVSQILDPRQPHNFSDGLVVAINVLLITVMYMLPGFAKQPVFAGIFLFWRACYNIGIGWLLAKQSKSKQLTTWAEKSRVFDDPKNAKNRPWLQSFVKHELEVKIPEDYDFDKAPLEYNTWLVFRRVVDLVLMCDFTSYCLFAYTCGGRPAGEILPITVARWVIGTGLIIFNLWVKLDAHRVVKDYAWYWGDFFYMTDKELTFDGVFKLFPHPMYSVGYAGYYGISLMAASYKVLLISVVAHVAQLTFLHIVENPHIEKTYPSPTKTENDNVEKLS